MATHWHQGIVTHILDESPTTKRFFLTIENLDSFDFRAGQFVTFDLPIGEKRLQRWRSYSISSAPNGTNTLELCIVRLEGGAGTSYFFDEVAVGTSLKFKGPDGNFCLPETIEKDIVMICTGTGIAPFRSMLHDVLGEKLLTSKIHLIFGCRHAEDILYRKEMEQLAAQYPDFQYDITLSREDLAGTTRGYVHEIYKVAYAQKRDNVQFYLCGWSKMIDEAVAILLIELGYDRKQIIYELYG